MEETTIFHERLNHKEEDGKGEQLEPGLHSNHSFDEQEYNQPSDVHEEIHPNFPYEDCKQHVEVSVNDFFKEDFIMPLYYECEDGHLYDAPQEAVDNNNVLDHQEQEKDSKWDTSLCFLDSKITFPDSMEKHNDILFETLVRNQVLNYEILYEKVDASFSNGQGNSSHGCC